jgi:hypothetical protein
MKKYLASKVFALALVFAIFMGAASAHAEAWKFGIISDTQ